MAATRASSGGTFAQYLKIEDLKDLKTPSESRYRLNADIILWVGGPGAVLLQHHHVPLPAPDLVHGDLRGRVLLPAPASLQVAVVLIRAPVRGRHLRHHGRQVVVVGEGVS